MGIIIRTSTDPHYLTYVFFFLNDPATTEIYPLPLHDALPICFHGSKRQAGPPPHSKPKPRASGRRSTSRAKSSTTRDRKSTRLNSSHLVISYAVFCLKKKKNRRELRPILHPLINLCHGGLTPV